MAGENRRKRGGRASAVSPVFTGFRWSRPPQTPHNGTAIPPQTPRMLGRGAAALGKRSARRAPPRSATSYSLVSSGRLMRSVSPLANSH